MSVACRYYISSLESDAGRLLQATRRESRIASIGYWTSHSGKMRAGSGPATPPRIWRSSDTWRSTCSSKTIPAKLRLRANAKGQAGTVTTCSLLSLSRLRMRLPWAWCKPWAFHFRNPANAFETWQMPWNLKSSALKLRQTNSFEIGFRQHIVVVCQVARFRFMR